MTVIVPQAYTTDDPADDERHVGAVIAAYPFIFMLNATDIVIDYGTGASWTHVAAELVVMQARRRVAVLPDTGPPPGRAVARGGRGGGWEAYRRRSRPAVERWRLTEAEREPRVSWGVTPTTGPVAARFRT